jgi:DNA-directed RNA polymerase subunit RPC12/RpoP
MTTKETLCPYCSETIMASAKKCKHCGERLTTKAREEHIEPK